MPPPAPLQTRTIVLPPGLNIPLSAVMLQGAGSTDTHRVDYGPALTLDLLHSISGLNLSAPIALQTANYADGEGASRLGAGWQTIWTRSETMLTGVPSPDLSCSSGPIAPQTADHADGKVASQSVMGWLAAQTVSRSGCGLK